MLDEFSHECLAIRVARKLKAIDVIDVLSDLFILRGVPAHIRSDNGPEFVAKAVQEWIAVVGAKTAYIERGSPWENGYIESFNARLRDELLNGEIFHALREAQIYNRASEHPSCYVIEEKRLYSPGCDPAGYLGFCRARSVIDRAADVVSAARAKIHGPSARGWIASISPASGGGGPSSAGLNTGMNSSPHRCYPLAGPSVAIAALQAVAVEDAGDHAGHLDQLLPVPAVAGEARDLACADGADLAEADFGNDALEAGALHAAGGGAAKIVINDLDLRPAKRREWV